MCVACSGFGLHRDPVIRPTGTKPHGDYSWSLGIPCGDCSTRDGRVPTSGVLAFPCAASLSYTIGHSLISGRFHKGSAGSQAAVVLKVWPCRPSDHLATCYECEFSDPTSDLLLRDFADGVQRSVFYEAGWCVHVRLSPSCGTQSHCPDSSPFHILPWPLLLAL